MFKILSNDVEKSLLQSLGSFYIASTLIDYGKF